jgi:hypothetical protein
MEPRADTSVRSSPCGNRNPHAEEFMKRVTGTYTVDIDDDSLSDDECFKIWNEIMRQDRHWPSNDQIKIEQLPEGTPDPTRP